MCSLPATSGAFPARPPARCEETGSNAVLDVPEVSPDKVRALVSQAPVYESIAVHVEAHGPLTAFPVTAHAALGSARVDAQGTIGLAPVLTASVAIDVRDLDLRALAPTAPPSALALHADVRADASADGRVSGTFALDVPAVGHVADQSIPVAAFQGHFRHEAGDADGEAILDGRVSEPGAPTMIHAEARIGPSAAVVQFAASSEIERLADVRRVGGLGPGQARVRIAGSVTLSGSPTLDAQVESSATGLRYAGVRLDRAKLAAHASGPLSSPTFTATLDVSRNGAALRAIVDQMRIADGRLDLLGISIAGLGGTAEGSLRVRPDGFRLHCDSKGIDVARLGYLLGMEGTLREGRVVFAADLSQAPNGAVGTIDLDTRHVSIGPTDGASGHLAASIDGRTLAGSMIAAATGVGSVVAKTLGVTLAGTGPLSVESLRRAWGTIEMDGRVELASLRAWLPPGATPLGKYVSGTLALHGHVERAEAESLPNVTVTLKTSDLVLSSQSAAPGDAIASALRPRTAGFDVQIDATANGPTGHAALAMQLLDKEGPLASIVAKSDHVPYSRLLASKAAALAWMIRTPFSALLTVPSRSIAHWPDVFRPNLASGDVQGSVAIEGTCLEPRLKVALQAHSLQFGGSPFVELLDVEANATYQGAVADVAVDASALGRKLLHASGRLHTSAWDSDSARERNPFVGRRRRDGSRAFSPLVPRGARRPAGLGESQRAADAHRTAPRRPRKRGPRNRRVASRTSPVRLGYGDRRVRGAQPGRAGAPGASRQLRERAIGREHAMGGEARARGGSARVDAGILSGKALSRRAHPAICAGGIRRARRSYRRRREDRDSGEQGGGDDGLDRATRRSRRTHRPRTGISGRECESELHGGRGPTREPFVAKCRRQADRFGRRAPGGRRRGGGRGPGEHRERGRHEPRSTGIAPWKRVRNVRAQSDPLRRSQDAGSAAGGTFPSRRIAGRYTPLGSGARRATEAGSRGCLPVARTLRRTSNRFRQRRRGRRQGTESAALGFGDSGARRRDPEGHGFSRCFSTERSPRRSGEQLVPMVRSDSSAGSSKCRARASKSRRARSRSWATRPTPSSK